MPKNYWKSQRKTARTKKRQAKRKTDRKAARRGFQEKPRSQRKRAGEPTAFLPGLLFARSLFDTLTGSGRKPIKFGAAAYRQAQRGKAA